MDEDSLRTLIREIVAEVIEATLAARMPHRNKLSRAQLEQRRAAAALSAETRRKVFEQRDRRRAGAQRAVESRRKRKLADESITSNGAVNGESNGETQELSTGNPQAIPVSTKVWSRYAAGFKIRYGAFPPRNSRANGLLTHLLKLVPAADAPDLAEFYLRCEDPMYTRANHPLGLLVRDAEKLLVMMTTGRTKSEAAAPRPWWEVWSGIQEQGRELGIEETGYENPRAFRHAVLTAAAAWGTLPAEAQEKLGIRKSEG